MRSNEILRTTLTRHLQWTLGVHSSSRVFRTHKESRSVDIDDREPNETDAGPGGEQQGRQYGKKLALIYLRLLRTGSCLSYRQYRLSGPVSESPVGFVVGHWTQFVSYSFEGPSLSGKQNFRCLSCAFWMIRLGRLKLWEIVTYRKAYQRYRIFECRSVATFLASYLQKWTSTVRPDCGTASFLRNCHLRREAENNPYLRFDVQLLLAESRLPLVYSIYDKKTMIQDGLISIN